MKRIMLAAILIAASYENVTLAEVICPGQSKKVTVAPGDVTVNPAQCGEPKRRRRHKRPTAVTPVPVQPEVPDPNRDSDGDGRRDVDDACPNLPGNPSVDGCPDEEQEPVQQSPTQDLYKDSDGDGVRDLDDKCPNVKGDPANDGCPIPPPAAEVPDPNKDSDGDGVRDLDDKCPLLKGDPSNNGCPKPDQPTGVVRVPRGHKLMGYLRGRAGVFAGAQSVSDQIGIGFGVVGELSRDDSNWFVQGRLAYGTNVGDDDPNVVFGGLTVGRWMNKKFRLGLSVDAIRFTDTVSVNDGRTVVEQEYQFHRGVGGSVRGGYFSDGFLAEVGLGVMAHWDFEPGNIRGPDASLGANLSIGWLF